MDFNETKTKMDAQSESEKEFSMLYSLLLINNALKERINLCRNWIRFIIRFIS